MATMTVTGPDGRKARISYPDGTSETVVQAKLNQLKSQWGTTAPAAQAPQTATPVAPAAVPAMPQMGAGEVAADTAKSLGIGLVQGGIGLATLPGNLESLGRMGINAAGRFLGAESDVVDPDTAITNYGDAKRRIEGYTGEFYQPKSTAGEYARTIGEFAPLALAGPGGMAARATNVIAPAVVSETAGQLTKGTSYEPWARAAGALAGGQLPAAAMRTVTPVTRDASRASQIATLQKEGVKDLTAGQITGSKPLRWAESVTQDTPFGGGRAASMMEKQAEQFTRAALKRAGVNADRATPDVIDKAFKDIGQGFDQLAFNRRLPITPSLRQRLDAAFKEYDHLVSPSMRKPVVENLSKELAPNTMLDGQKFKTLRSSIERIRRETPDPELNRLLTKVRDNLDMSMERVMPVAERGKWREVRSQYRNMLAIEKAATSAGENAALGLISPSALRTAVKMQNLRSYARGKGDLAALARAGEAIMKPLPQSGTAPRAAAVNSLNILSGIAGHGAAGIPGAVAGMAVPGMAARTLMSRPVQNYLTNQALAGPIQNYGATRLNALNRLPQAAMEVNQGQTPLMGGIGPRYDEYGNPL